MNTITVNEYQNLIGIRYVLSTELEAMNELRFACKHDQLLYPTGQPRIQGIPESGFIEVLMVIIGPECFHQVVQGEI